jgi:hypothetical protein
MYHDQGLAPIKLIGFGEAVNVTLGLPYIRTSVDHGTAFDIAGKGIARHDGMMTAIQWALRLSDTRFAPTRKKCGLGLQRLNWTIVRTPKPVAPLHAIVLPK